MKTFASVNFLWYFSFLCQSQVSPIFFITVLQYVCEDTLDDLTCKEHFNRKCFSHSTTPNRPVTRQRRVLVQTCHLDETREKGKIHEQRWELKRNFGSVVIFCSFLSRSFKVLAMEIGVFFNRTGSYNTLRWQILNSKIVTHFLFYIEIEY